MEEAFYDDLAMSVLGLIRVGLTVRPSLPVYPDNQTFSESDGMSQRCQEATKDFGGTWVKCGR